VENYKECVNMVDITKEELLGGKYAEAPKWREKKKTSARLKKFLRKNKFMTVSLVAFAICIIVNGILLYNFVRILSIL
jgi:hypothetical protein